MKNDWGKKSMQLGSSAFFRRILRLFFSLLVGTNSCWRWEYFHSGIRALGFFFSLIITKCRWSSWIFTVKILAFQPLYICCLVHNIAKMAWTFYTTYERERMWLDQENMMVLYCLTLNAITKRNTKTCDFYRLERAESFCLCKPELESTNKCM